MNALYSIAQTGGKEVAEEIRLFKNDTDKEVAKASLWLVSSLVKTETW